MVLHKNKTSKAVVNHQE